VFSERRGHWKPAIQSQELFRTLQRYYNNAYMDAEKQDAINLREEIKQYYKSFLWGLIFTILCNSSVDNDFKLGPTKYYGMALRATTSHDFKSMDFFETIWMLISFILLGKYLEELAKRKTSEAITKAYELGTRNSHVNESMITGEARPMAKKKGDAVIGGTSNENGVLHVQATRAGSESAMSQIGRLVESAQVAKAPVHKFADPISKYFVPLVITLSLSTWLTWYMAGKLSWYPKSWIPSSMDSFQLALQFGKSVIVIYL
ncbi:hypothetical protein IFM89_020271, partial [Coptis chinensis]